MAICLGIDTSNYTTSLALCEDGGVTVNLKKSVYVKENERGVRQSEALFCNIKNRPLHLEELGTLGRLDAVCYSARPRDVEGSYMPCFLAGELAARALGANRGVRVYARSHQAGHIRAAMYSAGAEHLIGRRFIAFHVSGGTTEMLLVSDGGIKKIGGTLDLTAGQAIDRTGVYLGLRFPCGAELEKLALGRPAPKVRVCVRGLNCNLSGLENRARKMADENRDKNEVAAFVLEYVRATLEKLTVNALAEYGPLPLLFAGGVMSCSMIRKSFEEKFGAYFAQPEYSCDNAAGASLLGHDALIAGDGGSI